MSLKRMIEYSMQDTDMNPNNLSIEAIDDKQFHEQGSHLLHSIELALEAADDELDLDLDLEWDSDLDLEFDLDSDLDLDSDFDFDYNRCIFCFKNFQFNFKSYQQTGWKLQGNCPW